MELLRVVFRHYRWPFIGVMLLSLLSAALGIGVIAFMYGFTAEDPDPCQQSL